MEFKKGDRVEFDLRGKKYGVLLERHPSYPYIWWVRISNRKQIAVLHERLEMYQFDEYEDWED